MLVFADPGRLRWLWSFANHYTRRSEEAADTRRRMAIDAELARMGLFDKMRVASAAIASEPFAAAFIERRQEREAAKSEDDIRDIALVILGELGVDMSDLQIRLRRATEREVIKSDTPAGTAQLKLRVTPTIDAAKRAIAAVDDRAAF